MSKRKKGGVELNVPGLPGGNAVDYLRTVDIPISVLNHSGNKILVDSVRLRFQPEWNMPSCSAIVETKCDNFEVERDKEDYYRIQVQPTPLFLAATNYFDVLLAYRTASGKSRDRVVRRERLTYIVLHDPPATRGPAFISFKDPEDLDLKNILKTIATRVGFTPYVGPDDLKPGTAIWSEKIQPAIKACKVFFLIWTRNTEFGTGVSREIDIAQSSRARLIPFIETGAPVPRQFASLETELVWFNRESAPATFSLTAVSCR